MSVMEYLLIVQIIVSRSRKIKCVLFFFFWIEISQYYCCNEFVPSQNREICDERNARGGWRIQTRIKYLRTDHDRMLAVLFTSSSPSQRPFWKDSLQRSKRGLVSMQMWSSQTGGRARARGGRKRGTIITRHGVGTTAARRFRLRESPKTAAETGKSRQAETNDGRRMEKLVITGIV